ncbi:MAG TPA: multicopper oxidase domain-containing protein [Candidatus Polarisedimenticolia bacterium]|jgi:spore coat protein A
MTIVTRALAVVLCATPILLATPAILADTVTINPIKDNTLYEPISQDAFADVSDGAGPTMFAGKVKDADADPGPGTRVALRRAVLAWDIAGNIPAGATINSVQLTLYCDKVSATTIRIVVLRRLTADWGEGTSDTGASRQGRGELATTGDATWRHRFYPSQFWTTPGGDYSGTISATQSVGNTGFYTWGSTSGMVADVQAWLNTPSQNFGWILVGDESTTQTTKRFGTRENTGSTGGVTWKPSLVVNYTPATAVGGCCQGGVCSVRTSADCAAVGGVYQGNGTSCSPNPCIVISGACCANSGTCSEGTQTACVTGGGTYQGDGTTCATATCPIVLTPYVDALPIPAIAAPTSGTPGGTATYNISMVEINQRMHRDLPLTRVWAYSDGVNPPGTPGPVIVAHTGQPVTVNWFNDIRDLGTGTLRTNNHYLAVDTETDPNGMVCIHGAENRAKTVVHLHGGKVPQEFDGYPEWTMLPGDAAQMFVYPNDQQAAPIWFHDHALGVTRLNVYMGLAGLYLVRDAVEDALNLPSDLIPLAIQDRTFNTNGSLKYPAMWMDHFFGDKIIVNGKVWPYLDVKRGKYRFIVLNGSTSRTYTLSFNPPTGLLSFTVIGTDQGLLEAPVPGVGMLTLGPGERYDVVVDFAGYAAGTEILLQNSAPVPFPNGTVDETRVMKFRVTATAGDTDPLPATLRSIQRLDPASAVRTRDFRLKQSGTDGCGRATWEINGLRWDDITEYPELGTTEIWRFVNDSGVSHPMHMHLVAFQVLDRDTFTKDPNGQVVPGGSPQPPPAEENGWKDTVMVAPDEIARVIMRFDGYKGRYPYHCHILEHEEHEMMRQFQVVSCGDGELDPTETCDDGTANGTAASCCSASCAMLAAGTACEDGSSCTLNDQCQAGVCVAGTAVPPPPEVSNVQLAINATALSWDPIPGAPSGTLYDVARGRLDELPVGAGASEMCLLGGTASATASDGASPSAGRAFWYLVRARHGCGTGTYGYWGAPPVEQVTAACP